MVTKVPTLKRLFLNYHTVTALAFNSGYIPRVNAGHLTAVPHTSQLGEAFFINTSSPLSKYISRESAKDYASTRDQFLYMAVLIHETIQRIPSNTLQLLCIGSTNIDEVKNG